MSGPLDGYKVVELTSTVSGPLAGLMLADQGAEVIKVEPPLWAILLDLWEALEMASVLCFQF